MNAPRILIAGIGNIFMGDDAFGCEVTKLLLEYPWPEGVRVTDFGIRGLDLAYALLDGPEVTILVDATGQGGAPGDVYVIEPDLETLDLSAPEEFVDAHTMHPLNVLRMAKMIGADLKRILLVGCEPGELGDPQEGLMGLSGPIQAAVPEAAELVRKLVAELLHEDEPRPSAGMETASPGPV